MAGVEERIHLTSISHINSLFLFVKRGSQFQVVPKKRKLIAGDNILIISVDKGLL